MFVYEKYWASFVLTSYPLSLHIRMSYFILRCGEVAWESNHSKYASFVDDEVKELMWYNVLKTLYHKSNNVAMITKLYEIEYHIVFFSFGRKDYQRLDKSDLEIIHSSIESE